jgi:exopolysaccharide biosynthesis polyprenyl glycosylphosphotransferase
LARLWLEYGALNSYTGTTSEIGDRITGDTAEVIRGFVVMEKSGMFSTKDLRIPTTLVRASTRRRPSERWIHLLLLISDVVAVGAGLWIAHFLRFDSHISLFHESTGAFAGFYHQIVLTSIPMWLLILAAFQLYNFQFLFGGLEEYARVFNACTTAIMLILVANFLFPDLVIARGWLLLSWFSVTALMGLGRFAVRRWVYRWRARGYFKTTMLIVGADEEGKAIAEQLSSNPTAGVLLAGFIDDNLPTGTEVLPGLPVLGSTQTLHPLVYQLGVRELMVSSSALSHERLLEIFQIFGNSDDVKVRLSSGLFEIMTTGVRVKNIGNVPLLSVNQVRLTGGEAVLKMVLDYVGAALGLIVLSPLFLLIAIAIKRASPGPVFHRRRVVGVGGREFDAFKFRTMVVDADKVLEQNPALKAEFEKNFKLKDDPRVTSVGRLLRKASLDELPQLINVLRGEMSLVGPRMITKEEVAKYGKWGTNLFTVKPGITGFWQVSGRSDVDYHSRVRLDMHYIRNYTIWLDLQILFQTVPAVLRKDGAY